MKYLIQPSHHTGRARMLSLLPCVAAIAAFVSFASNAQTAPDPPQAGLINPGAAVFNPATGKVYVVDQLGSAVNVIDDSAGKTVSLKVGAGPVSIAVDSANGRAYVANADDGTVSVVDGRTDAVLATLNIGSHPYSIAADSAAGKIYVTRTYSDTLTIIDAATNEISTVKTGSPDLLAINPKTHTAYLLGYEGGSLATMDAVTHTLSKSSVGMHAWGMALNDSTGVLYIARPGNAEIIAITPGANEPKKIPTGNIPCSVAVNPRTNTIYVANYADNSVTVIDGANAMPIATILADKRPEAVAIDAERNRVYVANTLCNSVTVIDAATRKVLATVPAGKSPYALVVNPRSGKIHVANLDKQSYTVLDGK